MDDLPDTTGRKHNSKRGLTPFLRFAFNVLHGIKEIQRFFRGEDFATTVCRTHGNIERRIDDPEILLQAFVEPNVYFGNWQWIRDLNYGATVKWNYRPSRHEPPNRMMKN